MSDVARKELFNLMYPIIGQTLVKAAISNDLERLLATARLEAPVAMQTKGMIFAVKRVAKCKLQTSLARHGTAMNTCGQKLQVGLPIAIRCSSRLAEQDKLNGIYERGLTGPVKPTKQDNGFSRRRRRQADHLATRVHA